MNGRGSTHFPGLDGLRGLAVAVVVAYHFGLPGSKGGFLGVDVFFVVSGFLVTKILSDELARSGSIDIRGFWFRRIRRLLPALLALLVAVGVVYGYRVPEKLAAGRLDMAASSVFLTNWRMIASSTSYFDQLGRPPLTRHLWSLAIEGQFYALWPIVLVVLAKVAVGNPRRMGMLTVLLAAISAVWCAVAYRPGVDPSRVYFGSDTHLVPVLAGAVVALLTAPRAGRKNTPSDVGADMSTSLRPRSGLIAGAAGFVGLVAIAAATVVVGDQDELLYRGGFATVAVLAAAVVWAATRVGSPTERLLGLTPLTWLGVRSYSLYLWHWPVVALTQPGLDVPVDMNRWVLGALRLGISLILTEVSFRCIEQPFRQRLFGRWWATFAGRPGALRRSPRWYLGTFVAAMAVSAGAAGVSRATQNDGIADSLRNPEDEIVVAAVAAPPPSTVAAPAVVVATSAVPTTFPPPPPDPKLPAATDAAPPGVAGPATTIAFRPPAVLAIGDSIMKGATPALTARLGNGSVIDAAISRPFTEGVKVFQTQSAKHPPFGAVVIHLGNNGVPTKKQFTALLDTIGPKVPVVFVTMRESREWAPKLNTLLREGTRAYPNMRVLEWNEAAGDRSYLFAKDKLHLSGTGGRYYSDLVVWALTQTGYVGPPPTVAPTTTALVSTPAVSTSAVPSPASTKPSRASAPSTVGSSAPVSSSAVPPSAPPSAPASGAPTTAPSSAPPSVVATTMPPEPSTTADPETVPTGG